MGKNRTMEAKRIKYIRQSKARPRQLRMNNGQMKVPQSIDRSKIPEEWLGLFAYRERAKTFIDDFLEAKFPTRANNRQEQVMVEKERILHTTLMDGKFTKVVMFSDTRMTCFYFIEYQVIPGLLRRSYTYGSHDRALQVFHLRTIRWKEVIQIDVEKTPSM